MTVAVMKTKAEQTLADAFEAAMPELPGGPKSASRRRSAMQAFNSHGLPHRRIEDYKYTDLRAALKEAYPPALADTSKTTIADVIVALGPLAHVDAYRMTFVNGFYRADLSDLDGAEAIEVSPLDTGFGSVQTALAPADGVAYDATVALNSAFVTGGAHVTASEDAKPGKPLLLAFVRSSKEPVAVTVRNVVTTATDASLTLIEAHVAVPGSQPSAQINTLSELHAGPGAVVDHIKIAHDFGAAVHLANWAITLGRNAQYRGFQFTQGNALARNQINVVYQGEGGKLDLSGAFLARNREHVDTTLIVDHAVPHCESRELFKGVLDGHGRGVFQGKIVVRPDAQKTDGKQMAQALMLSPDAEFDSKPELEIYADDVVCGHGTTSAELDEDLLFYCKSRGIPELEARALLIESFIGEAIAKVMNEDLRTALMAYATAWLASADRSSAGRDGV